MPENMHEKIVKVMMILHWLGKYDEAGAIAYWMGCDRNALYESKDAEEFIAKARALYEEAEEEEGGAE
jgi:hypothetical protein